MSSRRRRLFPQGLQRQNRPYATIVADTEFFQLRTRPSN